MCSSRSFCVVIILLLPSVVIVLDRYRLANAQARHDSGPLLPYLPSGIFVQSVNLVAQDVEEEHVKSSYSRARSILFSSTHQVLGLIEACIGGANLTLAQ